MLIYIFIFNPTFTLHALAKETLEQTFAVLADGRPGVGVDGEGVRHLDPGFLHLIHPDRPAAPGQDALPRLLMGPLLLRLEKGKKLRKKMKTTCRKNREKQKETQPQWYNLRKGSFGSEKKKKTFKYVFFTFSCYCVQMLRQLANSHIRFNHFFVAKYSC